jgi:hypothetical protein
MNNLYSQIAPVAEAPKKDDLAAAMKVFTVLADPKATRGVLEKLQAAVVAHDEVVAAADKRLAELERRQAEVDEHVAAEQTKITNEYEKLDAAKAAHERKLAAADQAHSERLRHREQDLANAETAAANAQLKYAALNKEFERKLQAISEAANG